MKYFNAYLSVNLNGRKLKIPDLSIEFDYDFTSSSGANIMTLTIYNPSAQTVSAAEEVGKVKAPITVDAGYIDDHGEILLGEVFGHTIKKVNGDIALELKCSSVSSKYKNAVISRSWPENTNAKIIIRDIFQSIGLTVSANVGEDKVYENGFSANGKISIILDSIKKDTKSTYMIDNGSVYWEPENTSGKMQALKLTYPTILEVTPKGKNYEIRSLFNHRIISGYKMQVESNILTGTVKVINGRHSFKEQVRETICEVAI